MTRTIYTPPPATIRTACRSGHPADRTVRLAAAFPATQATVAHLWINYTGCDSLYSTAADTSTAYFGGHERWVDNPNNWTRPVPERCPRLDGRPESVHWGHHLQSHSRPRSRS